MLATIAALALPTFASAPEDPGPHPVGVRDQQVPDPRFGRGSVPARIHYPALSEGPGTPVDVASGPHPLVTVLHGASETPDDLDDFSHHLASWGFVVALPATVFTGDLDAYAADAQALLWGVEALSVAPGGWLAGGVSGDPWTAVGHSLGGRTLSRLIGLEARIDLVLALEPASGTQAERDLVSRFPGDVTWVAGGADAVAPPASVHDWFEASTSARRALYLEIAGAGHYGVRDAPFGSDPLPWAEQHRLHLRIGGALLRAERFGEESLYAWLVADPAEPLAAESDCADPILFLKPLGGGRFVLGVAGLPGGRARFAGAQDLGIFPIPFGLTLDLDPDSVVVLGDASLGSAGIGGIVSSPAPGSWVQAVTGTGPSDIGVTRVARVP